MKNTVLTLLALWLTASTAAAQLQRSVTVYDEEDGVPSAHVTQLLQDRHGFLWFATWNGLCRYDGYEFQTFKSSPGDGCHISSDRFRDIALQPDGNILCRVNEDDYYLFDTRQYRFRDLTPGQQQQADDSIRHYRQSRRLPEGMIPETTTTFAIDDRQGNLWALGNGRIYKYSDDSLRIERFDITPKAEVKCLFHDRQGRYWVATKQDAAVRVYSDDGDWLLGYLAPDGTLRQQYTTFSDPVYCMCESRDGTLWLGTKPGGIYRLRATSSDTYQVSHLTKLPNGNVYDIKEDSHGRLWVATLGGGLCYTDRPQDEQPTFTVPTHYDRQLPRRVRFLHIAKGDVLMAATTEGLVVAHIEKNARDMHFRHHRREAERASSLSSNATMDILETPDGHILISTESGGINQIDGDDWLAPALNFKHFNTSNQSLPTDVALSMTMMDERCLMTVSGHLICLTDGPNHYRVLDASYFNADLRFSEAHPLRLAGGEWVFALTDGAFITRPEQMFRQAYKPHLVLTRISIQGGQSMWNAVAMDTLTLKPRERSVTVHFAALDYRAADRINYAFRLTGNGNGDTWNYIGHNRSATLLDLQPGTYLLEVRSTNADGEWMDNTRQLTIVVKPTFWESVWGRLLIVLFILGTVGTAAYTLLYIRRMKRKHHETLEKYLELMSISREAGQQPEAPAPQPGKEAATDPTLQRVMAFIEQNIGNSDVNIGDMAAAAATSRSGLQRKLKQAMGITPQDLLREARIKHACHLLRQTDRTVSEVAYACGFSDPKYFSRCFKQSTGQSPTEYKTNPQHM